MANIANLITKLTGIIASLDDIRDAISQGGGGSSTASGVSVTPTSPLTGTNLQATTNETAALLQEHTDDISALNSSISKHTLVNTQVVELTNNVEYTCPSDGYFKINCDIKIGSYAIGHINGIQLIQCAEPIDGATLMGYPCASIFVRKGTVIKASYNNGGHGNFFPIS